MNEYKRVYLANGEEVKLIQELADGSFAIETIEVYCDFDGNEDEQPGSRMIVDRVLSEPPVQKFADRVQRLREDLYHIEEQIESRNSDLWKIKSEIESLSKTKTDLGNMIINRREILEAKTVHVFKQNNITPFLIDGEDSIIRISFRMDSGKVGIYQIHIDEEGSMGYSNAIDMKYGIMLDVAEEDLQRMTRERVGASKDLQRDWDISHTDDKYLPEDLIEKKREILRKYSTKAIENAQKEIEKHALIKEENTRILAGLNGQQS